MARRGKGHCLTTYWSFLWFNRMVHDIRARGDVMVFIFEQWFEDGDKSGLVYDSETQDFN
jgi:hypothetical protein